MSEKTIFQKDYCQCEEPKICAYGFWFCSLGCGKPIRKTIKELRQMIPYRKAIRSYIGNINTI